ncbi:Glycoside hydrolase, 38 vacuolar alpha mannosidase, partial [Coelomomyces lativittatus]
MTTTTLENVPSLLKVPTSIYFERFEKFISPVSYNDVNLFSKLYGPKAPTETIQLLVYSVPDIHQRINFQQAKDAPYQPTQLGERFGPSWSTHWFKIQAVVPTAWRGETIVFVFRADNAECLIYDVQGHPIHGLSGGDWNDTN